MTPRTVGVAGRVAGRVADAALTGRRGRVLVVDDSAFMRRLVSEIVSSTGEFEVVGTARDGVDALRQISLLDPDYVTLDVDMPSLDGLACLDRIMRDWPRPVIMLSAGGSDGRADAAVHALERGAVDFVRKPSGAISLDLELVSEPLLEALRAAACTAARDSSTSAQQHAPTFLVCIAASTGGPAALSHIIPQLPHFAQAAVLIVQHMPAGFTTTLAARLHGMSRLAVHEAVHGDPVRAGHVYVAPGGFHLQVGGTRDAPLALLNREDAVWGVRPAADRLFTSVAAYAGASCLGVVLTGMGRDGADGLLAVRRAGGLALVQERTSCVIPGMPDAALRLAGADGVVALRDMAGAIARLVEQHVAVPAAHSMRFA